MTVNATLLVRNRPSLTQQTLDSFGLMEGSSVVVLDHQSEKETQKIVQDYCSNKPNYLYVRNEDNIGTGQLRNLVVQMSEEHFGRADHLYLSDNDIASLRPDWLRILVDAYEEAWKDGFRAIGAYNHPYHLPNATLRVSEECVVNDVYALASQSVLMRWEVWDTFGPFCNTPAGKVCQSEDADFCNRIRGASYKVGVISPALLVNCGITNSFGEHIPGWDLVKSQAPERVIVE